MVDEDSAGCLMDPLKVVLWLPRSGARGSEVAARLWELGHGVESADTDTLVMTITVTDSVEEISGTARRVADVIESLRGEPRDGMPAAVWSVRPLVAITPREAYHAPRERISLRDSVGRISAEQFTPYPPGVPLIGPGEIVTEEIISAIEIAGRVGRVAYCSDASLETIEVVVGH